VRWRNRKGRRKTRQNVKRRSAERGVARLLYVGRGLLKSVGFLFSFFLFCPSQGWRRADGNAQNGVWKRGVMLIHRQAPCQGSGRGGGVLMTIYDCTAWAGFGAGALCLVFFRPSISSVIPFMSWEHIYGAFLVGACVGSSFGACIDTGRHGWVVNWVGERVVRCCKDMGRHGWSGIWRSGGG